MDVGAARLFICVKLSSMIPSVPVGSSFQLDLGVRDRLQAAMTAAPLWVCLPGRVAHSSRSSILSFSHFSS